MIHLIIESNHVTNENVHDRKVQQQCYNYDYKTSKVHVHPWRINK
jgi:hypothetical protein